METTKSEQEKANEWFDALISAEKTRLSWIYFQTKYFSKLGDEHRLVIFKNQQRKTTN